MKDFQSHLYSYRNQQILKGEILDRDRINTRVTNGANAIRNAVRFYRNMVAIRAIPNLEALIEPHDENPAAENIKMSMGQPAMALPEQDHLAHLQTHLYYYNSPAYGKNPAILPMLAPTRTLSAAA